MVLDGTMKRTSELDILKARLKHTSSQYERVQLENEIRRIESKQFNQEQIENVIPNECIGKLDEGEWS